MGRWVGETEPEKRCILYVVKQIRGSARKMLPFSTPPPPPGAVPAVCLPCGGAGAKVTAPDRPPCWQAPASSHQLMSLTKPLLLPPPFPLWAGVPEELPHSPWAAWTDTDGSPMADSLLNHSWPSFSKRWMKRWSFKRGNALGSLSLQARPGGGQQVWPRPRRQPSMNSWLCFSSLGP